MKPDDDAASPRHDSHPPGATTQPTPARQQTQDLLDAQRQANSDTPRNFKDDALTDKQVRVEPDGTGPTPTDSFDTERDRDAGSGNTPP